MNTRPHGVPRACKNPINLKPEVRVACTVCTWFFTRTENNISICPSCVCAYEQGKAHALESQGPVFALANQTYMTAYVAHLMGPIVPYAKDWAKWPGGL